jgi:hypothetical protein
MLAKLTELAMIPKSSVRRLRIRLDRIAGEMNEFLLVLAIGLGCFYLSVAAILNMPQLQVGPAPEGEQKSKATVAPVSADAASAYLLGPE